MTKQKKKTFKKDRFEDAIRTACEGLFYPSETDAEIIPVFGGKEIKRSRETILQAIGLKDKATVEERSFVEFFSRLTKIQDWFTQIETRNSRRFLKLQKVLEENLDDLIVLRTGRIQIDIYVVGVDAAGNLAGIKTKAVET